MTEYAENSISMKDVTKIGDTAVTKIGDARHFFNSYLCENFRNSLIKTNQIFVKC